MDDAGDLVPGAHVAVLADDVDVGIEGRFAGLELRDTLLLLRSGPVSSYIFLFRKPLTEGTVAGQTVATGTGGLNVEACRVGVGRWPSNFVLVHGTGCCRNETAWECESRCPVNLLDRQSGELTSGMMAAGQQRNESKGKGGYHDNFPDEASSTGTYGDSGGASRFFPQFKDEGELLAWVERLVTPEAATAEEPG
jgi:site-specific DNA-methyltransferase (adenine-specific)